MLIILFCIIFPSSLPPLFVVSPSLTFFSFPLSPSVSVNLFFRMPKNCKFGSSPSPLVLVLFFDCLYFFLFFLLFFFFNLYFILSWHGHGAVGCIIPDIFKILWVF